MARKTVITEAWDTVGDHNKESELASAIVLIRPRTAERLWLQALSGNVRFRLDGVDPDTDTGFQLKAGSSIIFGVGRIDVRIIREQPIPTAIQYQWLR